MTCEERGVLDRIYSSGVKMAFKVGLTPMETTNALKNNYKLVVLESFSFIIYLVLNCLTLKASH